jgi:hypothetical protein
MGNQRTLAENEGAPRMRVKRGASSRPPAPGDLELRRLERRIAKLERQVKALTRAELERKLRHEFEAKPGDV